VNLIWISRWQALGVDIALAPLADSRRSLFHRSASTDEFGQVSLTTSGSATVFSASWPA
jgi:hypothetical protein